MSAQASRRFCLFTPLILLGISPALAQSMKPGLWEYKSTVEVHNPEMQAAMAAMQAELAAMPPEQRRQMEQMMGAQLPSGKPGAQVMKVCITPEKASAFDVQTDTKCTQKVTQKSKDSVKFSFACQGEPPTKGEGSLSFQGDTRFSGKFQVESKVDGELQKVSMSQEGKWLGSDCPAQRK